MRYTFNGCVYTIAVETDKPGRGQTGHGLVEQHTFRATVRDADGQWLFESPWLESPAAASGEAINFIRSAVPAHSRGRRG